MGEKSVCAHPGSITSAVAKVQSDGSFELRLRFDIMSYSQNALPNHGDAEGINALLDGPPEALESTLVETKERFRQNFHVKNGGSDAIDILTFPNAAEVQASVKGVRVRLPVMASVTVAGHLLPNAKTIAFQFDEGLGQVVLTTEFPYHEPVSEPVDAGAWSEEQRIPSPESVAHTAADFNLPSAAKTVRVSPPAAPTPKASAAKITAVKSPPPRMPAAPLITGAASPSPAVVIPAKQAAMPLVQVPPALIRPAKPTALVPVTAAVPPVKPVPVALTPREEASSPSGRGLTHFAQFIKMGYLHILPEGVDHILFVVGLFLLSTRIKPLLTQVTAFTVAHSLTLALSLYGIIHLLASVVEPIIAISIAFVAVENLLTREMKPWRPALVFGFGLIHGLGFASALQEMGLKQENLLPALLGFNVGVELGQLTVVMAAFLIVGRFRNHPKYRSYVVIPGSVVIAATALFGRSSVYCEKRSDPFPMLFLDTPALILAPMEGLNDAPMRTVQGDIGAFTFAVAEFIRISASVPGRGVFHRIVPELYNGAKTSGGLPVFVQILGGDADRMALSALVACEAGATSIDINFGCPAKTVNNHDGGASLLKHPQRIREIVRAVRDAVPPTIPVSAKLRLGWDTPDAIYENAQMAAEGGANWLTIHGRTRQQGYLPPVLWKPIGLVREQVGIPVVANGDIWSLSDFRRCRDETGCCHFMLGRGALGNPFLSHQVAGELGIAKNDESKRAAECAANEATPLDWRPYLRRLVAASEDAGVIDPSHGASRYLVRRLKQWLKIAALCGNFSGFDDIKRAESVDELFALLETQVV